VWQALTIALALMGCASGEEATGGSAAGTSASGGSKSAAGGSATASGGVGGAASGGGATSASGGDATSGVGGNATGSGGGVTVGAGGATSGVGGMTTSGVGGMTTSGVGGMTTSGVGGMTTSGTGGSGGGPVASDACGHALDGPWFEIDYSGAFTATNPAWTYSATPGWGEPEWAASGSSWPEVWDLYNNINVSNDPIGKVAVVGPSGVLQIMLGIGGMTAYSHATVCVEGRSVATSSQVVFDVYNPLNNCGASATMAHDWSIHATAVNLGTCLIPNNDFQAIRIDPTGGSSTLGVMRVTLVLHNAIY
jgi:hypothetical protein